MTSTAKNLMGQFSQGAEDATLTLLEYAPENIRSQAEQMLSDLNSSTTCTIKSAPPRTKQEVTQLSSKCGWLMKRDDNRVWRKRWCCVVPHTFLYYFEAQPVGLETRAMEALSKTLGENVSCGADANMSSSTRYNHADYNASDDAKLKPTGIIDLERYKSVDKSPYAGEFAFRLTSENSESPLEHNSSQPFYFQGLSIEESEEWKDALQSHRYSIVADEREGYKQVNENLKSNLQKCTETTEKADMLLREAEKDVFTIRGEVEERRKNILGAVRNALERRIVLETQEEEDHHQGNDHHDHQQQTMMKDDPLMKELGQKRFQYLSTLDNFVAVNNNGGGNIVMGGSNCVSIASRTPQMNAGVFESIEMLSDFTTTLSSERNELRTELNNAKNELLHDRSHMISKSDFHDVQRQLEQVNQSHAADKINMAERLSFLEHQLHQNLSKIEKLTSHKKVLKNEVIDMRGKMDYASHELKVFVPDFDPDDLDEKLGTQKDDGVLNHCSVTVDSLLLSSTPRGVQHSNHQASHGRTRRQEQPHHDHSDSVSVRSSSSTTRNNNNPKQKSTSAVKPNQRKSAEIKAKFNQQRTAAARSSTTTSRMSPSNKNNHHHTQQGGTSTNVRNAYPLVSGRSSSSLSAARGRDRYASNDRYAANDDRDDSNHYDMETTTQQHRSDGRTSNNTSRHNQKNKNKYEQSPSDDTSTLSDSSSGSSSIFSEYSESDSENSSSFGDQKRATKSTRRGKTTSNHGGNRHHNDHNDQRRSRSRTPRHTQEQRGRETTEKTKTMADTFRTYIGI